MKNVAIIGGGLGGIASAIRFKARGYDVAIYERLNELGGRAQKFSKDGYLHDAGPTVITAPYLFNELFSLLGEDIDNYVTFQPLDPWYRFYFNDGTGFDYGPDRKKMLEQIDQISPNDVDGYLKMLKRAEEIFELGYERLASEPFNKILKMVRYGPDIIRLGGYKSVYSLSEKLMAAARKDNAEVFVSLYAELKTICSDNENTDKDHPEQWETLADFTEDLEEAVIGYKKALEKATTINSKDHMSSIAFSMASLQLELGDIVAATQNLQDAKISANKIADKDLKKEIDELLETLLVI